MNSNDPIFKTDLASLKYSNPMAFIQENTFNDTQSSNKEIYSIIKIN